MKIGCDNLQEAGLELALDIVKRPIPAYTAVSPSSSSMRSNWLNMATRSLRAGAPVLIWPALVATTRSAMVRASLRMQRTLQESVVGAGAHVQLLHGGAEQALAGISHPE
jgi:hypothetical protein